MLSTVRLQQPVRQAATTRCLDCAKSRILWTQVLQIINYTSAISLVPSAKLVNRVALSSDEAVLGAKHLQVS